MLPFYIFKSLPPLERKLRRMYLDRAHQIVPKIAPFIKKHDRVLDIGCGTGIVSGLLKITTGAEVTLSDVKYNEICNNYPVIIYDGTKLPFKDNEFDKSLIMAVLHHASDPGKVLEEAKRVTKGQIIIMEDVFTDLIGRTVTLIGDCLVNFEIHSPQTNHNIDEWTKVFKKKGLKVDAIEEFKLRCVGFPFKLAIFVLSKDNHKN